MSPYRIAIVDDDPEQHDLLGEYLGMYGYELLHAFDGVEGERLVRAEQPDLVLLDIIMPERDGLDTLAALKAAPELAATPVLLVSSRAGTNAVVKGLEAGAEDYVTKPFVKTELLARIRAALRRSARYVRLGGVLLGDRADVALVDLLQTMQVGAKDAVIELKDQAATCFLRQGTLAHVTCGQFSGVAALRRVLWRERGGFSVTFGPLPPGVPDEGTDLRFAVMDALTYLDEVRRELGELAERSPLLTIEGELHAQPLLDRYRQLSPIRCDELLLMMEGELKVNARVIAQGVADGSIRAV